MCLSNCTYSKNYFNFKYVDFQAKPSSSKTSFEPKRKRRKKKISQELSGTAPLDENGENNGGKISLLILTEDYT